MAATLIRHKVKHLHSLVLSFSLPQPSTNICFPGTSIFSIEIGIVKQKEGKIGVKAFKKKIFYKHSMLKKLAKTCLTSSSAVVVVGL